jgi:radical SAM superfamily enzyme YgiQ (UPF0313 family)
VCFLCNGNGYVWEILFSNNRINFDIFSNLVAEWILSTYLMKIGLLDIDGHNFPNLALMKISAYHKSIGDQIEWINYFNDYDYVYQSKIFSFSPDNFNVVNANKIIKGGTGYDPLITLPSEISKTQPDYSLYPNLIHAYGFLTRGCPNKCSWCIVPKKEGDIRSENDIEEIL